MTFHLDLTTMITCFHGLTAGCFYFMFLSINTILYSSAVSTLVNVTPLFPFYSLSIYGFFISNTKV